ncbi:hypothetical protein [Streptomyces sp. SID11385]|uniref:hypothetical protein n=1 Tax=Streptomyces sp. SID11385 TaxID=2706031 RepID=UPI0013C7D1DE|nr:hypothetical protein [Streptomyces sp. SID11385]NEA42052.1 hypothetical protein [Streptomyces sp. SID11385]
MTIPKSAASFSAALTLPLNGFVTALDTFALERRGLTARRRPQARPAAPAREDPVRGPP